MKQETYAKIKVVESWLSSYKPKTEDEVNLIENVRKAIKNQRNSDSDSNVEACIERAYRIAIGKISIEDHCSDSK